MSQALKAMGAFAMTFAVIGALNFFGLPRSSTAAIAGASTTAVSISPEELTRAAGPLPVQEIENYF